MDKKGETEAGDMVQILSFALNLGIIFAGIFVMILLFYTSQYEFRQIESDILLLKINKCVKEKNIDFGLRGEPFKNEFLDKCNINEKVLNDNLLLIIEMDNSRVLKLGEGDGVQCGLSEKNEEYLRCSDFIFSSDYGRIFIQTGSNQKAREEIG